jgi:hypothetical protein
MPVEQYISADSHVLEPATLWLERLDKAYRDKAPRVGVCPTFYTGRYWA